MKKTWKLGEWCIGGTIKVEKTDKHILIQALDWNTKKVVLKEKFDIPADEREIEYFLESQITTSYYAGKIVDWIQEKQTV